MKLLAPTLFCLLSAGCNTLAGQVSPQASASAAGAPEKAVPVIVPAAAPAPNTLLDGTAIKLRLVDTISSANAQVGQPVAFEVLEEVDVAGVVVIPKGAQALATVTEAQGKRAMGRGGKLDVKIDSVRLADGEKAALRANQGGKGGGHVGAMTAGIVGTAIVFFPAAPLLLFIHGKDITIPKGTEVTAFVAGDMHVETARFAPADGAAAGAVQSASLTVEASVSGAEIEVDGSFAGSTPSTLSMTPGQHTIAVKKKGFRDWSRTMTVAGTGAKVSAELEANP